MVKINNLVNRSQTKSNQSMLSKLFRFLIKVNLIPLKWDKATNEFSFKYLSKQCLIHWMYGIVISILYVFTWFIFGIDNWLETIKSLFNNSNATDMITFIAFIAFSLSQLNVYQIFCKNLTKISKQLTLTQNLDWPIHGTNFLIFLCLREAFKNKNYETYGNFHM